MQSMLQSIEQLVGQIGAFVWGPPMLIFLVGTGFWLTIALRGVQFSKLWHSLYLALIKRKEKTDEPGDITHFQTHPDTDIYTYIFERAFINAFYRISAF